MAGVSSDIRQDVRVAESLGSTLSGDEERGFSARTVWTVVAVLALVAAVLAVVVNERVYPLGSHNNDDQAYVAQAHLLEDGKVRYPRSQAAFFRPNMTGPRDDKLVYVYTPAWAAVLAASDLLSGSTRPALALDASLAVVALALLASELWRDRRVVLTAAVVFTLSPLFVSQSGTYLSYQLSLSLALVFGWLLLRGLRTGSSRSVAVAGAVVGVAFFARPFDALLVAIPLAAFAVLKYRGEGRALLRPAGWLAVGVLPLVVLTAAYNQYVMGSPTSFPQNVAGSMNTFGFGPRIGIHDQHALVAVPTDFTLSRSLHALWTNVQLVPRWLFGSYLLLGLAAFGAIRNRRDPRIWLLVALTVAFPLGYLFWWGIYTATTVKLVYWLGPFYYYPVVAFIAMLAASGAVALWSWLETLDRRRAITGGALIAVVATGLTLIGGADGYTYASKYRRQERASLALLRALPRDSLILLEQDQIGNPHPELVNRADLSNRPLYGLDDIDRNVPLLEQYPGMSTYALRHVHEFGDDPFTQDPREWLSHVTLTSRNVITETVTFRNPGMKPFVIAYAEFADHLETRVIDTASVRDRTYTFHWTVTPQDVGSSDPNTLVVPASRGAAYALGFATSNQPDLSRADRFQLRWSFATSAAGPLRVVEPPTPFVLVQFPTGASAWLEERVDPVMSRAPAP